jgi:hypothetical protein
MAFGNDFVTITNRYKTGRIQSNRSGGYWFVRLIPLTAKDEPITVSGASFSAVKEEITRRFGNAAVFSLSATTEVDPVAAAKAARDAEREDREPGTMELNGMRVNEIDWAWEVLNREYGARDPKTGRRGQLEPGTEITWDMCRKQGIRRKVYEALASQTRQQFKTDVTAEHRTLAVNLSREEQLKISYANFNAFATDPNVSNAEWVAWFKQRPGFLSWPNQSWKNRDTLLSYCESKGWVVPVEEEIAQAMHAILNARGFHLQSSYKRMSENYIRDAVRPITGNEPVEPQFNFSDQEIEMAGNALRKSLPAGTVPNMAKVQEVAARLGISDQMLEAISQRQNPKAAKDKTATELKADMQAQRNAERGGAPISRAQIRRES